MDQIIANLEKVQIDAPLRSDLDQSFVQAFDKVFSFGDGQIKVVGTVNDPWFRSKDLLRCMGYSMDRGSVTVVLKKIDDDFKSSLESVLDVTTSTLFEQSQKRQIDRLNESKEVYINEPGLYQLIMSSKLPSAKPFKSFVYKELLPGIRKIVQEKYERELANREDKIDVLIKQNDQHLKEIVAVRTQNDQQLKEIVAVRTQNTLALQKLAQMGITLEETREELGEVNMKLDVVVEERAPIPTDYSRSERFVFLKRQHERYPYYVIRSQQSSCKASIKKQEKEHGPIDLLLDFEVHPNSKTYYNRLKLALNKRGVKFCRNDVRIEGDITEQEVVNEFYKINEEKKNI